MNERGEIRKLASGEQLAPGEIDITEEFPALESMGTRARKDFYRAIKQGLSRDAALACAQATHRAARGR